METFFFVQSMVDLNKGCLFTFEKHDAKMNRNYSNTVLGC